MRTFLIIFFFISIEFVFAQIDDFPKDESCTSIMAGKKATTDGSVITSHTCDGKYRTWLNVVKGADFKDDAMLDIYSGTMVTETPWDTRGIEKKGSIKQAAKTFTYLNTAYPCMNEKQLIIGESTISGKKELVNNDGLFKIENLQAIALQRCSTARDAIKLIGELVKEFGYGDNGECLTIADKNEVWMLEIFGEGPNKKGAVWAAQRIPDNEVGVSANISRISEINLKDKNYFMASENVFEVAKNMGFWDGEEPFKFWKAYSGAKPFQVREYFILSTLAPSLNLDFNAEELPFSVKPDKKISVRDVFDLLRSVFEGTQWDMTKNLSMIVSRKDSIGNPISDTIKSPYANPWMRGEMLRMLNYQNKDAVTFQRTCAVAWCSYSFVGQCRDWLPDEIGGVCWFSFDNPAESPRIPIFCGTLSLPESFNYSGQFDFNEKSAHWQYRQANRLATIRWGEGRKIIEPAILEFENKVFNELEYIEKTALNLYKEDKKNDFKTSKCSDYLSNCTNNYYQISSNQWIEIRNKLWTNLKLHF
ncbi:MAG: dipeptidase [Bacteroidales bacterium]|nr:dipeptidase [Bacteroidales bacterium]